MQERSLIVVFGASGGIGLSSTSTLLEHGYSVLACSRNIEPLHELHGEPELTVLQLEDYSTTSVERCFEVASSVGKEISGVLHCVGSILLKPITMITERQWEETLETNLSSAFRVAKASFKSVKQDSSLIFFSSAAASIGLTNHAAISASKAAVSGLVKSLAAEGASRNIRVNAIAPGLTETRLAARIMTNEKSREHSRGYHALNRFGTADEIGSLVTFLLGNSASWITGQTIAIDGGLSTVVIR